MKLAGYLHEIDKAEASDAGVNAARDAFKTASAEMKTKVESDIQKAMQGNGPFLETEIVYAASFRCKCGAGMAYPDGIGLHGSWYCSAILKGEADTAVEHTPAHPFAFYEVKSEGQPTAYGATTRPDTSYIEESQWWVCKKCQHSGIGESYRPPVRSHLEHCPQCGADRQALTVRYFAQAYFAAK